MIETYRHNYPVSHKLLLRFGSCCIEVAANIQEVTDQLLDYYSEFIDSGDKSANIIITVHDAPPPEFSQEFIVKTPDPGKTKIKEEFLDFSDYRVVRKRLTGMVFFFGKGQNMAIGPCLSNLNQVVNFINNRYIEWELCRGCLLGHAASVIYKGNGLAIAGFSGAGKSTLALHVMNHGAVFVSNDRLMIERQKDRVLMYGVAKLPRINPGTILNNPSLTGIMSGVDHKRFSKLPKADLWALEHKYDAPITQCFGKDRFVLDGPMHVLAVLNWKHDGGPMQVKEVSLLERQDLLPAFMKSTGLFFMPYNGCQAIKASESNYMDYLSLCKVLEFSGGADFEAAAQTCVTYLETGSL